MTTKSRHPHPRAEGGIALIIVLISIFVLSILAGGFAYSMKVETKLARNANSETELLWLGRSGVEYCKWILAQQLMIPNEPYDGLDQVWAGGQGGMGTSNSPLVNVVAEVHLGRGSFTWKIVDLERKVNINTAPPDVLEQAMTLMGVDAAEMTPTVNSILDWIDPDDSPHVQGAETDYYQSLPTPYMAKNGPIDDMSELLLIKGVTPEIYWGIAATNVQVGNFQRRLQRAGAPVDNQAMAPPVGLVDLFTPLSTGKININTASSSVLQLVPGIDNIAADAIVGARGGTDDGTGLTGPFRNLSPNYLWARVPGLSLEAGRQLQRLCDIRSRTFEIQITANVGGYTRTYYSVVGRNSPRDLQILSFYWK